MNTKTKKRRSRPKSPVNFDASAAEGGPVQIIGNPMLMATGVKPVFRALTLEDVTDDCPTCLANRAAIEAGRPPMAWVYE